jgi:prolyl oligopeptidase
MFLDDEQVVPMHSYKLIAGLQHAAPSNPNPLLLRVGEKGGHGQGRPVDQRYVVIILSRDCLVSDTRIASLKEYVDKFGFLAQSLGLVWQGGN